MSSSSSKTTNKTTSKKTWYESGINFKCQGSGKCCTSHGEYGFVYLTLKDRQSLARELGLSTLKFTKSYCQKNQNTFYLKEHLLESGEVSADCVFLKNKRCDVYNARPTQCSTWPFWPDTLQAKTWNKEVVSFCPGINKGRLYSKQEIETIAADEKKAEKEIFGL